MTLEQVIEKLENSNIHEIVLAPNQLLGWLKELRDTRELEEKHWSECMQIARYDDELKEAKRLLKLAVEDFNKNICDDFSVCSVCTESHKDPCETFKWRYADEALKLLGEQEG